MWVYVQRAREQESVRERARGNGCTITQKHNHGTTQSHKHALAHARMHGRIDRERDTYRERVRRTYTQACTRMRILHSQTRQSSSLSSLGELPCLERWCQASSHLYIHDDVTPELRTVVHKRTRDPLASKKKPNKNTKKDTKKYTKIYRTHTHTLSHTHTSHHITPHHKRLD